MLKKILTIIILINFAIYILPITTKTYASAGVIDADTFKPSSIQAGKVKTKASKIVGILTTTGVVVSVVMMMYIGIKYMVGSVEERAEYKETMIPYIIGGILIFASSFIANIAYKFGTSINNL